MATWFDLLWLRSVYLWLRCIYLRLVSVHLCLRYIYLGLKSVFTCGWSTFTHVDGAVIDVCSSVIEVHLHVYGWNVFTCDFLPEVDVVLVHVEQLLLKLSDLLVQLDDFAFLVPQILLVWLRQLQPVWQPSVLCNVMAAFKTTRLWWVFMLLLSMTDKYECWPCVNRIHSSNTKTAKGPLNHWLRNFTPKGLLQKFQPTLQLSHKASIKATKNVMRISFA